MSIIDNAVTNSFSLVGLVIVIDVVAGLPVEWLMVQRELREEKVLDFDLPLAFSTAVLGRVGRDRNPGLGLHVGLCIILIFPHFIFTYPYMVRFISAIPEQIDLPYETAAMTLGASRLAAVRTITLSLFRVGLVTGIILCLTRSLLETGGTYIALKLLGVQNTFFTRPTYIKVHMSGGDAPLILISSVMIIAILLLFLVKWMVVRFHIKNEAVWSELSRSFPEGLCRSPRMSCSCCSCPLWPLFRRSISSPISLSLAV